MSAAAEAASLRVLVVDDDADQRLLLRRLFKTVGIGDVSEASNGREALELVAQIEPSLVVLDLTMPVMSGMEVLPALVDAAPQARVVVLSNMNQRGVQDEVRSRGAVGFVEKRVSPNRLVSEILLAAALTSITARQLSSVQFPDDRTTPRLARRYIRELLTGEGEELVSNVELLVSELATNAVLHAASAPLVDVRLGEHTVHVGVFDSDPNVPTARTPDLDAPGGRGLLLLDALASRWGIEPRGSGKVVWFELDR